MELRQLRHFLVVAEEHHFTRAAERLHIVQSGLSASINALERDLGVPLFVRTTRRVELTDAGRTLLMQARRTLDAADSARDAVAAVRGLVRGRLTVGVMQGFPATLDLAEILGRFHRKYDGVEIRLVQAGSERLLDDVRTGRLDLAFPALASRAPQGVVTVPVAESPLVLACAPSHRLAKRARVTLADIGSDHFVDFPDDWAVRVLTNRVFADAGVARRSAFEVNDLGTCMDLVTHGLGVALVPLAVAAGNPRVRCVPLKPAGPMWVVVLATAGQEPVSVAARALVAMVLDRGARGMSKRPRGTPRRKAPSLCP